MSLTDTLGSLAVATKGQYMTGVSVDIGTSFLKPAGVPGDTLKARATVTGIGRTLAFTKVDFTNVAGDIVAYGHHTKFVGKAYGHPENVKFSDDDLADQAPFDSLNTRKTTARRRQSSSSLRAISIGPRTNQLRIQSSALSIHSFAGSETDQSEIHSPAPRRHFLQTDSHQWLKAGPLSSTSSRPNSPLSIASTDNAEALYSSSPRRTRREQTLSFSSLLNHDHVALARQRKATPAFDREHIRSGGDVYEGGNAGAGKRWIRWMHRNRMRDQVLVCSVAAALWIKWCVGLGGYSGAETPPMFGDYEAQRHWMELTNHLRVHQWYTYDLQYWGLDYPPLTAYHSWICGFIGSLMDPSWFELDKSRGIETPGSKVFMLDSGHFQYNSIMLGFTLLALDFFSEGRDELGAICFVASLAFKQMALYYAPAIGSSRLFIRLAVITVASFVVIFIPFLPPFAPLTSILDPITRIFPFARGLFEDKVANFWCASNIIFKWRSWFSQPFLIKLSAALTALGSLPSAIDLVRGGWRVMDNSTMSAPSSVSSTTLGKKQEEAIAVSTLPILPWAMLSCSMSFFLFSFQVHEKTILLPLLPLNLLLSGASNDSFAFEWGVLVNNVAVFSMWPLLKKDGLTIPYFALTFFWNYVLGYNPFKKPTQRRLFRYLSLLVYAAILFIHFVEMFFAPPRRYPDLFPVLNVLVSTPVFFFTWLWSIKRSTEVAWGISGMGGRS
ncbi:hypothetical protein EW145_g1304 [Phellinidium pouzarii]|uniref:Alpha-1,3-glucosyltransferase n=1 Tax=Phellinidium pouzarii TaxID=167371 RepID=A0A4S4LGU6_9AGAM|nr:hypothetical protein EW145_g1304 [Phellinidium pouzarii]